jgi:hypothetical protein
MLWILVSAIVVLIVGLVMLAVFTNVLGTNPLLDFKNRCELNGRTSCRAVNSLPEGWPLEISMGGARTSCQEQLGYTACPSEWLQ